MDENSDSDGAMSARSHRRKFHDDNDDRSRPSTDVLRPVADV